MPQLFSFTGKVFLGQPGEYFSRTRRHLGLSAFSTIGSRPEDQLFLERRAARVMSEGCGKRPASKAELWSDPGHTAQWLVSLSELLNRALQGALTPLRTRGILKAKLGARARCSTGCRQRLVPELSNLSLPTYHVDGSKSGVSLPPASGGARI